MPSAAPSLADISNVATFALLGVGQIVTWVLIGRDNRRAALKRAATRASAEAAEGAAIHDLAQANTRIAKALEKLEQWARTHEIDDERRWSRTEELHKNQAETNSRLTNIAEDLARRITNVAMNNAPAPMQELPANRPVRARAAKG